VGGSRKGSGRGGSRDLRNLLECTIRSSVHAEGCREGGEMGDGVGGFLVVVE